MPVPQNHPKGKYKFGLPFKQSQCTKPINYDCAEHVTTIFKVGDVVDVIDFGFDDKINDWLATILLNGQNIPVSLDKLIKVDDSTPATSPQQIVNTGGGSVNDGSGINLKGLSTLAKFGIGIAIVVVIIGLLKLFKVF